MTPRIAVATCSRYESQWLKDEWDEHVSWADHVVHLDTRGHESLWIPRVERVDWMMTAAEEAGCEWVMILDVDERLSYDAEGIFREIMGRWRPGIPFAYKMSLWEMFTPTERRVDGQWGRKHRRRFFHLNSRRRDMTSQSSKLLRPVIAHTHHLDPANDVARVTKHNDHNTWDRAGRTGEGFDYLADREGMILRKVPDGMFPPLKPWRFEMTEGL